MIIHDTNFMRQYKEGKTNELVNRLCVILLFMAFVGVMFCHQPLPIVASLFFGFTAVFTLSWYPAIQNSADQESALAKRLVEDKAALLLPARNQDPASVDLPNASPPPRSTPEN